jgi:hypothetical protein
VVVVPGDSDQGSATYSKLDHVLSTADVSISWLILDPVGCADAKTTPLDSIVEMQEREEILSKTREKQACSENGIGRR